MDRRMDVRLIGCPEGRQEDDVRVEQVETVRVRKTGVICLPSHFKFGGCAWITSVCTQCRVQ